MTSKPTRFDGAQYNSLATEAERHDYLIALHQSIRDELQASLAHYQSGGSVNLPAGFTREELIRLMAEQINGQDEILKRLG